MLNVVELRPFVHQTTGQQWRLIGIPQDALAAGLEEFAAELEAVATGA